MFTIVFFNKIATIALTISFSFSVFTIAFFKEITTHRSGLSNFPLVFIIVFLNEITKVNCQELMLIQYLQYYSLKESQHTVAMFKKGIRCL